MAKRVLIGTVATVGLLLVVALVLPFVIDLNQFKPQIKAVVSDAVNADLEFSSARLTILTGLGVRLKGVSVTNTDPDFSGTKLFSVDDLDFHVELIPLLSMQFFGNIKIDKPEIIFATKAGKNNLGALAKPKGAEETPPPTQEPGQAPPSKETIEKLKKSVSIRGLAITDARFIMRDNDKDKITVKELNVDVKNIGLDRDIPTLIETQVKVNEAGAIISGPIKIELTPKVETNGAEFKKATLTGKINLDGLAIKFQDAFVKASGIPLNITLSGEGTANSFDLNQLEFNFHTLKASGKAQINDFNALNTKLDFKVASDDLQSFGDLLPKHKDMLLAGSLAAALNVDGPVTNLEKLGLDANLKTQLTGSDLTAAVKITNAKAPVGAFTARSQLLDLDRLLGPFMPKDSGKPAAAEKPAESTPAEPTPGAGEPAKDFALSEEQREQLKAAKLNMDVDFAKIVFSGITVDSLVVKGGLSDLKADLNPFGLNIFGGSIKAVGQLDLNPSPIAFNGDFQMTNIAVEQLIAFVAPQHAQTVQGKANIGIKLSGSGTTPATLQKTLNGEGEFKFLEGVINGGSISDLLAGKLNGVIAESSITKAADQVFAEAEKLLANPVVAAAAKGKSIDIAQYKEKYASLQTVNFSDKMKSDQTLKDVSGKITIKDGKVGLTCDRVIPAGRYQLNGTVGLDSALGGTATFTASDTLKQQIVAQSKYADLMFDDQGGLELPMTLGGTVASPEIGVNFDPIKQRFAAKAKKLVEAEVKAELEKAKQGLINDKLKKAQEALEAKKKEAAAKLAEEQAKAKAKVDEEKQKAKAEAEKKANEKKDEGVKKLKKKFGF